MKIMEKVLPVKKSVKLYVMIVVVAALMLIFFPYASRQVEMSVGPKGLYFKSIPSDNAKKDENLVK